MHAKSFPESIIKYRCSIPLTFVAPVVLQLDMQIKSHISCIAFVAIRVRASKTFIHLKRLPAVAFEAPPSQQLVMLFK